MNIDVFRANIHSRRKGDCTGRGKWDKSFRLRLRLSTPKVFRVTRGRGIGSLLFDQTTGDLNGTSNADAGGQRVLSRLETLSVDDRRAGLVVLAAGQTLSLSTVRATHDLAIHICWKVESEARMEPPIQTEYSAVSAVACWPLSQLTPLGRADDLDLHRRGGEGSDLLLHSVGCA